MRANLLTMSSSPTSQATGIDRFVGCCEAFLACACAMKGHEKIQFWRTNHTAVTDITFLGELGHCQSGIGPWRRTAMLLLQSLVRSHRRSLHKGERWQNRFDEMTLSAAFSAWSSRSTRIVEQTGGA
jgi:hypothetical protein